MGWRVTLGSGLVPLEVSVPFRQLACVLSRVGLALVFCHCVPFWLDACQALRWGGFGFRPGTLGGSVPFRQALVYCPRGDLHLRATTVCPFG